MDDTTSPLEIDLSGLPMDDWLEETARIIDEQGYVQPLGDRHAAILVEDKPTLLVSFETFQGVQTLSPDGHPMGWEMVRALGWSHLCVMSDGDTWFRDPHVFAYLDRLTDDGFFDDFDQVLFYGAGPGGYAAAAFSVAAPGATVVAVQPQATLDPRVTEWDDRFTHMRRVAFDDRYGFAPDMLDAAREAFVIYDPRVPLDAMHAALFTRPNVTKLRMPSMGSALQSDLLEMQLLFRMLARAAGGKLDDRSFARLYRARRDYGPYLRKLLARLDLDDREGLVEMLCRNVTGRLHAPRFKRRLDRLLAKEAEQEEA